jgi:hypothetical protein
VFDMPQQPERPERPEDKARHTVCCEIEAAQGFPMHYPQYRDIWNALTERLGLDDFLAPEQIRVWPEHG